MSIKLGKISAFFEIGHIHTSFKNLCRSAYVYFAHIYIFKVKKHLTCQFSGVQNLTMCRFLFKLGWVAGFPNFYQKVPFFFLIFIKNTLNMTQIRVPEDPRSTTLKFCQPQLAVSPVFNCLYTISYGLY